MTVPVVPETWNKADAVALPPIVRSLDISYGARTPFANCQKLIAPATLLQYGRPEPLTANTCPVPPMPSFESVSVAEAKRISPCVYWLMPVPPEVVAITLPNQLALVTFPPPKERLAKVTELVA